MIDIDLLHPRTVESFILTTAAPRRRWPVIILVLLLLIGAGIGAVLVIPPERQPPIVREVVRQVEHVVISVLTMIRS